MLLRVILLLLCICVAVKSAGWKDPNIVCCDDKGKWVQIPDEFAGSPPPPLEDLHRRNDSSIIVLIAALRETRLADTLVSLFKEAAHPERVIAGVVQQNAENDIDCVVETCEKLGTPVELLEDGSVKQPHNCKVADRIRVLRLKATEAAGPVYARARGNELVQNEDFCMQIDAHTVFRKDWDVLMSREWGNAKNEYAILTTYPTSFKDLYKNANHHWEMPHLCSASIHGSGVVVNSQAKAAANLERPLLAPLWAAGLSFSKCHAEKLVPNDPNLLHVFAGEEFARGVRFWTHGYDFYSLSRPIIGTYYGSDKGGKGGWRSDSRLANQSRKRMATLLKAKGSDQSTEAIEALGKYGLGNKRTIEQYYEFSGIDPMHHTTQNNCVVQYVPWKKQILEKVSPNLRKSKTVLQKETQPSIHSSTENHINTLNVEHLELPHGKSTNPFSSNITIITMVFLLVVILFRRSIVRYVVRTIMVVLPRISKQSKD